MKAAEGQPLTAARVHTLNELFLGTSRAHADLPALGMAAGPERLSYREFERRVMEVASRLERLGIQPGDRVALLSENRPEWPIVDYAVLSLRAVTVAVYPSLPTGQVLEILADCEPRLLIVADEERASPLREAQAAGEAGAGSWRLLTLAELRADGEQAGVDADGWRARARLAHGEDVATLIYTSGTTGRPKGVILTHENLAGMVAATLQHGSLSVRPGDVVLSVLPLAHSLERAASHFFISCGATVLYATSMQTVAQELKLVRPHHLVAVPRLFEKAYNAVVGTRGPRGRIARWAARVAYAVARRATRGRPVPPLLRAWRVVADRLVYRVLRERMGGRIRTIICGGAPLERHIAGLFLTAGIPIHEGYGLTETSPVISANRPGDLRLGSAGIPYPGVALRIAADDEIQVRGPHVTQGYWRQPDATAEAFTPDGWFRTGDVGSLDRDGFLYVIDRLKDLIVTAGGKNLAPGPLEQRVCLSPAIAQAVILGDRRPYPVLLVVPEPAGLLEVLGTERQPPLPQAAADPRAQAHIAREVVRLLHDAARVERPKRFAMLTEEFSVAEGLLTPTLKVRRRAVAVRYRALLDRLYAQEEGAELPWPNEGD
jgi:long-chain acyl-CoA synthetase